MENNKKQDEKKRHALIALLALITVVSVCTAIWAIFYRDRNYSTQSSTDSEFEPVQVDSNVIEIGGDEEKLSQPEGGGAVNITFSDAVNITLSNKEMQLMVQNPNKSNQNMTAAILIDGKVIAQSGLIKPGFMLEKLENADTEKLSAGTYGGIMAINFYDPETNEKSVMESEFDVMITVTE